MIKKSSAEEFSLYQHFPFGRKGSVDELKNLVLLYVVQNPLFIGMPKVILTTKIVNRINKNLQRVFQRFFATKVLCLKNKMHKLKFLI
jgi:hypothetical protein